MLEIAVVLPVFPLYSCIGWLNPAAVSDLVIDLAAILHLMGIFLTWIVDCLVVFVVEKAEPLDPQIQDFVRSRLAVIIYRLKASRTHPVNREDYFQR